jgi:hypothetical protein
MRALSLWQPWASLVAHRFKTIETRSWSTKYRGPIAIAATASKPKFLGRSSLGDAFRAQYDLTNLPDYGRLPHGAIVCLARLVAIEHTERVRDDISEMERVFGNYEDGRFAWFFEGIARIIPIPAKGMQGLWTWDESQCGTIVGVSEKAASTSLERE